MAASVNATNLRFGDNLNGLILFGITIVFVKALHELGHAYVATYYKCKVSSIGLNLNDIGIGLSLFSLSTLLLM